MLLVESKKRGKKKNRVAVEKKDRSKKCLHSDKTTEKSLDEDVHADPSKGGESQGFLKKTTRRREALREAGQKFREDDEKKKLEGESKSERSQKTKRSRLVRVDEEDQQHR